MSSDQRGRVEQPANPVTAQNHLGAHKWVSPKRESTAVSYRSRWKRGTSASWANASSTSRPPQTDYAGTSPAISNSPYRCHRPSPPTSPLPRSPLRSTAWATSTRSGAIRYRMEGHDRRAPKEHVPDTALGALDVAPGLASPSRKVPGEDGDRSRQQQGGGRTSGSPCDTRVVYRLPGGRQWRMSSLARSLRRRLLRHLLAQVTQLVVRHEWPLPALIPKMLHQCLPHVLGLPDVEDASIPPDNGIDPG